MNKINFQTKKIENDHEIEIEGIRFDNTIFIEILIDGIKHYQYEAMDNSLVVDFELARSLSKVSGKYLIFTSVIGISDTGGWDGVSVLFTDDTIAWEIDRGSIVHHFIFNLKEYEKAVESILSEVENLSASYEFEPSVVVFPESWDAFRVESSYCSDASKGNKH